MKNDIAKAHLAAEKIVTEAAKEANKITNSALEKSNKDELGFLDEPGKPLTPE